VCLVSEHAAGETGKTAKNAIVLYGMLFSAIGTQQSTCHDTYEKSVQRILSVYFAGND
jgi:hypothetical protein